MQLDHVTLRTSDLAATRHFFLDLFDLKEGSRPAAIRRIPGHWLYAGDAPIVHLIAGQATTRVGSEAWDHVGFRLSGYAAFRDKLDKRDIPYSPMDLPEINERRLFFRAPGGPLIEAVFRDAVNAPH
jgi:glyoxylase I family protein